jgi:ribosome maturation protein SDO1
MPGIQNTIIARYEKGGERFEVLVDPKLAYDYRTGAKRDLNNVLITEEVFKDANKGDRQTSTALQKAFGTTDPVQVAHRILMEGDLQLTTEHRRKVLEEKKAKVIAIIARNAVDPRTKAPHPPARIQAALEQARVHIDAFKSAEEQVPAAIEALREILPISLEQAKVAVKVPAEHAPRVYGLLKEFGLQKEEWTSSGALVAVLEMPAGLQAEFYDKLNKATGGSAETKKL